MLFEPPHIQIHWPPSKMALAKTAESTIVGAAATALMAIGQILFSNAAFDLKRVAGVGFIAMVVALAHGAASYLTAKGTATSTAIGAALDQTATAAGEKFLPPGITQIPSSPPQGGSSTVTSPQGEGPP